MDDDLRFLLPDEAMKAARQWTNAGGGVGAITRVLDYHQDAIPDLNDSQLAALREKYTKAHDGKIPFPEESMQRLEERWRDKGMSDAEIDAKRKSSKLYARHKKSRDMDLIADALEEHHWNPQLGANNGNNLMQPEDIWGEKGRGNKGVISGIDDTLQRIREKSADAARKAEVPDLNEVRVTRDRANAIRGDIPEPPDMPTPPKGSPTADALRKGFKVIKGGMKMLTPVAPYIGALGFALDAKDAYSLTESTMNPETEEDMTRQKHLADLMRRNEFY